MDSDEGKKEEGLRCKKCDSKFGYLRIKDHIWICRSCGYEDAEVCV